MNRTQVLNHFALAERHVAEGEYHVANQRKLIEKLARDGLDTTTAEELLTTLEASLTMHRTDRDRLRKELDESIGAAELPVARE
jgi:uncharacterized coiled-coil protein SlyX